MYVHMHECVLVAHVTHAMRQEQAGTATCCTASILYLNDLGIDPLILLFSNRSEVRFGKVLSSGGIVPVSCTHNTSQTQVIKPCY